MLIVISVGRQSARILDIVDFPRETLNARDVIDHEIQLPLKVPRALFIQAKPDVLIQRYFKSHVILLG